MYFKKIAYKVEPILKLHRYICAIITSTAGTYDVRYKYVGNLKEVIEIKNFLKKGEILEVYRASHNFIKAYERLS